MVRRTWARIMLDIRSEGGLTCWYESDSRKDSRGGRLRAQGSGLSGLFGQTGGKGRNQPTSQPIRRDPSWSFPTQPNSCRRGDHSRIRATSTRPLVVVAPLPRVDSSAGRLDPACRGYRVRKCQPVPKQPHSAVNIPRSALPSYRPWALVTPPWPQYNTIRYRTVQCCTQPLPPRPLSSMVDRGPPSCVVMAPCPCFRDQIVSRRHAVFRP